MLLPAVGGTQMGKVQVDDLAAFLVLFQAMHVIQQQVFLALRLIL